MLIFKFMCCCCRPGSIRADAFRGHGLSLLEKTTLRGLRTRAIPANVFGGSSNRRPRSHRPPLTRTGKAIYGRTFSLHQLKNCVIGKRYTSSPYTRRLLREERHRWDPAVR